MKRKNLFTIAWSDQNCDEGIVSGKLKVIFLPEILEKKLLNGHNSHSRRKRLGWTIFHRLNSSLRSIKIISFTRNQIESNCTKLAYTWRNPLLIINYYIQIKPSSTSTVCLSDFFSTLPLLYVTVHTTLEIVTVTPLGEPQVLLCSCGVGFGGFK